MIMANAPDKGVKNHLPMVMPTVNKDRIPSRHEKQRNENPDNNQAQYYLFGD